MRQPEFAANASILIREGKELNITDLRAELTLLSCNSLAEQVLAMVGPERLFPDVSPEKRVGQFQHRLNVQPVSGSRIVNITFLHHDPELAVQAVSTLIRLFALELEKLVEPEAAASEALLLHAKNEVRQAENALVIFKQNSWMQLTDGQRHYLESERDRLEALLMTKMAKEQKLEQTLTEMRRQFAGQGGDMQENWNALLQMKQYQHELLRKYDGKDPLLTSVQQQIEVIKKQFQTSAEAERAEKLAHQIMLAGAEFSGQEEQKNAVQRQLNQLNSNLRRHIEQKKILKGLQDKVEERRQQLTQLMRKNEASLLAGIKEERVVIIELPQLPLEPIRTAQLRTILAAAVFAVLGSLLYGLLRASRSSRTT